MDVRVFFFTWAYPPLKFPRSIQISRLVQFLDYPVHVICSSGGNKDPIDPSVGMGEEEKAASILRVSESSKTQLLHRIRGKVLPNTWWLPDPERSWTVKATSQWLNQHQPQSKDVLVTFGNPMSDHLAGLQIKKRVGLPWIAHFSDPWVDNPYFDFSGILGKWKRRMERSVIQTADRVVFVSQESVDLVMAKYPPSWRDKVRVIPHAFDPLRFPKQDDFFKRERLIVRYLGNFYGKRGPEPLFQSLATLQKRDKDLLKGVTFELYSNIHPDICISENFRLLTDDLLVIKNQVDYQTSLNLMRSADILLLIDAASRKSVFLPSKLIDYIGSGQPILGITPPGSAQDLIHRLGGWVANPDDPDGMVASLQEVITMARERKPSLSWGNEAVRSKYLGETVGKQMKFLIDQLVL